MNFGPQTTYLPSIFCSVPTNVALHGESKWNGIGFVCISDSKPQKDFNLAMASDRGR